MSEGGRPRTGALECSPSRRAAGERAAKGSGALVERSAPRALGGRRRRRGRSVTSRGSLQGVDAWTELGRDPPSRSLFPALIYGGRRVMYGMDVRCILPFPMHVEEFH